MTRKHLLSQLAHVEIFSPRPTETVTFFEQQLGLETSTHAGQSVYMRGWGEFFHHSVKITESGQSGLGHLGWRAESAEALNETVRALEAVGLGEGWIDGDTGHGAAYRFRSPDGHLNEVFWEVERWQAPPALKSSLRNRPQKYVGRGAAVRRLDHVTINTTDVCATREFYQNTLGFQYHEGAIIDGTDKELTAFVAVTPKSHDLGIVMDAAGVRGRLNHIAFWQETREEVLRAADLFRDYDRTIIEYGPGRHAISEGFFLYVREPGGNRVELFTGDTPIYEADWESVRWPASEGPGVYWGSDLPQSMYIYATPPVDESQTVATTQVNH